MKFNTLIFFAALCVSAAIAAPSSDRIAQLDSLIEQQNFDQLLYRIFPQVSQGRVPALSADDAKQDIPWLRVKSEEGHVPLMYFLSWKLLEVDVEESRKWNARARVGIMLDHKDCAKDPRSPWYTIFEGRLVANNMTLRENDALWYRSVDEALSWYTQRSSRPSTVWYCGPNNILPQDAADAGRAAYWKKIKENNDKKIVPQ